MHLIDELVFRECILVNEFIYFSYPIDIFKKIGQIVVKKKGTVHFKM